MKHARPDYDRIQDPLGLIPANEPVFLIRGQDIAAPQAVRAWAAEAMVHGAKGDILDAALEQAKAMERWQETYGSAIPDLARDAKAPDLIATPTDEVSSAAGRVLGTDWFDNRARVRKLSQRLADAGIARLVTDDQDPTDTVLREALDDVFGDLLHDAKTLAGFAMRSDRTAGPNNG